MCAGIESSDVPPNNPNSDGLTIGMVPPVGFWLSDWDERQSMVARSVDVGINHLYMADHVSFHDGSGNDGFVEVAALSQLHPSVKVMISIYLLPLRHPLPVARQLATMHKVAPGRMMFGVGVGGEDRNEIKLCGVDPSTRGRQTNESLEIIRRLMAGATFDYEGEFFQLERASIKPEVTQPIPIIVGGRSNAALTRAGRYGDGWIGVWCSPRRFEEALQLVQSAAEDAGRANVDWLHGYQPWLGVGDTKEEAREVVAREMEAFYKVPFEKFERYTPYGTPDQVAEQLKPYVDQGCRLMNLKVCARDDGEAIEAAGAIGRALKR